jgi:DNA-binding NarL/FixJ family response regulator
MSDRPRILLVEDHPVTRRGTAALLAEHFEIVGTADEVAPAVEMILERAPDLVLLDVNVPGGGGASVIKAVRAAGGMVPFLAFTVLTRREDVVRMFGAGVDGYLVKTSEEHEVIDGVRAVLAGQRPVSAEVAGHLLSINEHVPDGSGVERLTPREREVTELIARGYTYRECATRLGISVKTLENHMDHIFRKLGVQSRHDLTSWAYRRGFFRPDDDTAPA